MLKNLKSRSPVRVRIAKSLCHRFKTQQKLQVVNSSQKLQMFCMILHSNRTKNYQKRSQKTLVIASRDNRHTAETVLCLHHTALKKGTVVQWYLTVAFGRKTNLSQKAGKRSGYGIFGENTVGIRDIGEGGGIEVIYTGYF